MSGPARSPEYLLRNSQALVLSVSDYHANVLLRTKDVNSGAGEEIESLLKLTVIPNHKEELVVFQQFTSFGEMQATEIDLAASEKAINFLGALTFELTSESGAEYSYYTASDKSWWGNYVFNFPFWKTRAKPASFKAELISPASDRQIQRSMPAPSFALVEETLEMYESVVKPHIQMIIGSGALSWIQNVVDGTKEAERCLLDTNDFILNVDTKWRSHPNALSVPREEWFQHKSTEDLYCLAIVKDGSIMSLRDLRGHHTSMLRSILKQGRETIGNVYGVSACRIRVFVHYHPQFYHFHVHFTRLENEIGCQVERGHLLNDIIQNLELDSEYYSKRTISYKLSTGSDLYALIQKAES